MTSATLSGTGMEREELDWILSSGVLGRSTNLARMLTYICERHFEGHADEITEYRVAVDALGRRSDFDPHTDTIVRVTTHLLRKRLQEIYQGEGVRRPVRIVIPAGNYVPSFVPNEAYVEPESAAGEPGDEPQVELEASAAKEEQPVAASKRGRPGWGALYIGMAVAACLGLLFWWQWGRMGAGSLATARIAVPAEPDTVRALVGSGRKPYVDHSGNLWQPGSSCVGGTSLPAISQRIVGTEDAELYLGGVRGIAHCTFPAKPGMHEIHLYFAETSGLEPVRRKAIVSINGGPDSGVDVADLAVGVGSAVTRVWTGIEPERDGLIHLDFTSEVAPLNAVEILPAPSDKLLPVRIVAGDERVVDQGGNVWESDRYFVGGRRGAFADALKPGELGIYDSDRVGRMRYTIPVVAGAKYKVKLYFREPWFGKQNGGGFGPGARVFNVSANGVMMLRNFDILASGNGQPVVQILDDVEASPDGEIELFFMPVVNHPLINAIEVIPEG